jgi:hypothetical protein
MTKRCCGDCDDKTVDGVFFGVGVETRPPSPVELREWRALRSLAQPGPETLRTVYRIAFPTLLDEFDRLTRENAGFRSALDSANALIGEAADEAKRLQDRIDQLEALARMEKLSK